MALLTSRLRLSSSKSVSDQMASCHLAKRWNLDALECMRRKMFVRIKNQNLIAAAKRKAKRNKTECEAPTTVVEEDMNETWLFNGHFAFVLCGSMGSSAHTFSCLSADGKKVPRQSRAETRKKADQVKDTVRSNDKAGGRGVSTKDQFAFATLEHSQDRDSARHIREMLVIANVDESNVLKQLIRL